jgi:hypothetical protein
LRYLFNGHHCDRNWFNCHFAKQQFSEAHVRFGSEADIKTRLRDVRFAPESGHGARAKKGKLGDAYFEVASGSIPLFLIVSEALAEARNSISRLEPSMSTEPATTAAENV